MTADDDLSPEDEERLTAELLRDRVGIDPGKTGPLVDLAAVGIVNSAWRNTCVENWHAEGRPPGRDDPGASAAARRLRSLRLRWSGQRAWARAARPAATASDQVR